VLLTTIEVPLGATETFSRMTGFSRGNPLDRRHRREPQQQSATAQQRANTFNRTFQNFFLWMMSDRIKGISRSQTVSIEMTSRYRTLPIRR
jgi:hypothetical protein